MNIFFDLELALVTLSFVLAIIAASEIGRTLMITGFFNQALIGIVASATVLGPLTYLNSALFLPFAILISVFAIIKKIYRLVFHSRKNVRETIIYCFSDRRVALSIILSALFGCILGYLTVRPFFLDAYIFETHDVLYLGWIDGFWNFSNSGSLIVNSTYPQALGAFHVLPGIAVALLGAFSPEMNLIFAQYLKFLLIFTFISYYFFSLIRFSKTNPLGAFSFLAVFALLAGRYLGYCLGMSSYLYALLLIAACINIFWKRAPRY